jgi:hypothetical protein
MSVGGVWRYDEYPPTGIGQIYLPNHWRKISFASSGSRCVDTNHGRCLMKQLQLMGLLRSNSHAGNKVIQCYRHCKERGGERSEPVRYTTTFTNRRCTCKVYI